MSFCFKTKNKKQELTCRNTGKETADDVPVFKRVFIISKTARRTQSITRALPVKNSEANSIGNVKYLT